MPVLSKTSKERLDGCHPQLIALINAVIKTYDFAVICGYRNQQDQNAAYNAKKSKLKYPNSKHNSIPSRAVDIAPVKYNENGSAWIDWEDLKSFHDLADIVRAKAEEMNIGIRWGGDWDGDPLTRNKFNDYPHFELTKI